MTKTPEQWRDYLSARLTEQVAEIQLPDDYYNGDHRLSFATNKFKEAFGDLFEAFATNWCALVVDVAAERLEVLGFRFGEDDADQDAWSIWQANQMDKKSLIAHTEAIKLKTSYLLVGPPRTPGGEPMITVESPFQCYVETDPSDGSRLAGIKKYQDTDGSIVAVVYLPDAVYTWRRESFGDRVQALGVILPMLASQTGDFKPESVEPNPTGEVLLIPLENNAQMLKGGTSDLRPAIALNDAANKFFTDMIHASEFIAFPQRVLTGVELPKDPVTGEVASAAQIQAAVSRLWAFEAPDAKVSQLPQGDLGMFVEGVDLAVKHMAAQTRTPPHYLLAELVNISGDALTAAETGLEHRCKRKHLDFSDPHEEAMRLAFKWRSIVRRGWVGATDDAYRATLDDAETIWRDPANRDPVSLAQSLTMKQAIGVPEEVLWEEAGYSPQQIRRMKVLRDAQQKREAALLAQNPNAQPQQGGTELTIQKQGGQLALSGIPGPPTDQQQASAKR